MEKLINRPEFVEDKHLDYLDRLRNSGATNMFGAGMYLTHTFSLNSKEANKVLAYWMATYTTRHPQE